MKLKKKIKIGIDSPSAAGAGTISKMLAKNYNLLYCDTGKIYRYMAKQIIEKKPLNKIKFLKKISKKINLKKLNNKNLLTDDVAYTASQIAKDLRVRKLVVKFQKDLAYRPPKKFNGSILDGRDINSKIVKDADFKFYVTASVTERAKRRFNEMKSKNPDITFSDVIKNLEDRDIQDSTRKDSPLMVPDDAFILDTSDLEITDQVDKIINFISNKFS